MGTKGAKAGNIYSSLKSRGLIGGQGQDPSIKGMGSAAKFNSGLKKALEEGKISIFNVTEFAVWYNPIIKLPNDNTYLALNLAIEFLNDRKFKDDKIIDVRIENQIILNDWRISL